MLKFDGTVRREGCRAVEMRLERVTHDHHNVRACQMRVQHHKDRWALLEFDGRVVAKGAEEWKRASHVLHTTTATSEHVKCVFSILRIFGRLYNSTA